MGGAVSAGESNDDLIDNLLDADYIKCPIVERVFRAVDRAHYLTPEFKDNAYKDLAWKCGNLHLSAPCIYSEVMENLSLSAGLSFLNLGSGTGYLSTMVGLILGPYGINHGIEIHDDVVQYANTKLEEFWNKSSALDEFEFCKPLFITGNCLNLNPAVRRYDRVYCGAACPEDHENYMKNLLNIGGVLVMPLNDQLLQYTRLSESTWENRSVLPVSFASLLSVDPNSATKLHLRLPDNEPLSLQDACRFSIRRFLRQNIDLEHPSLTLRNVRHPRRRIRKRAVRRRLVIPIFEDSDGEGNPTREVELGFHGPSPRDVSYSVQRQRTGHIMAVIEMGHGSVTGISVRGPTREERGAQESVEDDETEEEVLVHEETGPVVEAPDVAQACGSSTMAEQRKKVPKREKFDSGLGEEMENGKGLTSDDEDGGYMDIDTESDSSEPTVPSGEERWSQMGNRSDSSHTSSTLDSPIWKRVMFRNNNPLDDNSDGDSDSGSKAEHTITNSDPDDSQPGGNMETYSFYMKQKIETLPLPASLKEYINLYRDF